MVWVVIILAIAIIFIVRANKENKHLEETPFIYKYPIIISGINEYLFDGDAQFETKDVKEHYLFKNSLAKKQQVQFIYRKNTLYLKYYEDLMEIKTTFSFHYTGIEQIDDKKQLFIAQDFCDKVKNNSNVSI